jgi:POT family proton-dependent oligopeptide transporter
MSAANTPVRAADTSGTLWGHPRQLWMLLAVTTGFNFSFYGYRAYLAPYIAEQFYGGLSAAAAQRHADLLASGFLALLYATPIAGGYVADKILGEARAVRLSLWLNLVALLLMAQSTLFGFEMGMALCALSVGLGIPLTVLIGRNYADDDPRREGGYTLFYLAVNLGSFIAPFICADLVGQHYGFRWGFIAAAVGEAIAAAIFQLRAFKLEPLLPPSGTRGSVRATIAVVGAIAVLVVPTALLLSRPQVLGWAMYVFMAALLAYFVVSCIRRRNRVQTQRYVALLVLFGALVMFWTFSFQGVTSLNFFARDYVNAPFNYTLFQAANPLYILLLAPLMAVLWPWLSRRGRRFIARAPAFRAEALVLGASGFMGVALGGALSGAGLLPHLSRVPPLTIPLAVPPLLMLTGQIGLNPIAVVALIGAAIPDPAALGVAPAALAFACMLGWALAVSVTPMSASAITTARWLHVSPWRVSTVWNAGFAAASLVLAWGAIGAISLAMDRLRGG